MPGARAAANRIDARNAWSGDPPERGGARDRLLDATVRCIVRDGLASTGVASVAGEAGVSRPTVYRYFADRHALVSETLQREGAVHATAVARHLRRFSSGARMAVEAELFVLRLVPEDPLLSEVWDSAAPDPTLLGDTTRPATIELTRIALADLIERSGWSHAEADEACELMLRFLFSLLIAPDPRRDEREMRRFLERRLVPALGLLPERNGAALRPTSPRRA